MRFWFADGIYTHALTTQLSFQLGGAVCDDANVSWEVLLTPLFLERDWRTQHLGVQKASHFVASVLWCCLASLNCEELRGNSHSTENTLCSTKKEHNMGGERSVYGTWPTEGPAVKTSSRTPPRLWDPEWSPFTPCLREEGLPRFLCHWKQEADLGKRSQVAWVMWQC